jgi:uncharacterized membrane protein YhaH (DUF805 family)
MLSISNQEILSVYKGRLGRLGFLAGIVYIIAPMLIAIALLFVLNLSFGSSSNIGFKIIAILMYVFSIAWAIWYFIEAFSLLIRRWHDLGQSGFLSLLSLVPGVNFIVLILLLALPGTKGPNQYGETPTELGPKGVLMPKSVSVSTQPVVAEAPAQAAAPADPGTAPDSSTTK